MIDVGRMEVEWTIILSLEFYLPLAKGIYFKGESAVKFLPRS